MYELDIKSLLHEDSDKSAGLFAVWPNELPRVDGVFVCYDASNSDSFQHFTELLGTCGCGFREYMNNSRVRCGFRSFFLFFPQLVTKLYVYRSWSSRANRICKNE